MLLLLPVSPAAASFLTPQERAALQLRCVGRAAGARTGPRAARASRRPRTALARRLSSSAEPRQPLCEPGRGGPQRAPPCSSEEEEAAEGKEEERGALLPLRRSQAAGLHEDPDEALGGQPHRRRWRGGAGQAGSPPGPGPSAMADWVAVRAALSNRCGWAGELREGRHG
jgi:hypothetical protein